MVGDRLDRSIDPRLRKSWRNAPDYADADRDDWGALGMDRAAAAYLGYPVPVGEYEAHDAAAFRKYITLVGAEEGWKDAVKTPHQEPVPFDEPTLGIIGMWGLGGGANPHFALALGEMTLRVGQRYLAWGAYDRPARMAERFWPDAAVQHRLNPASVLPFAGVFDFLTAMYLRLRAGRTGRIGRPLPPGPHRAPGGRSGLNVDF
jgi:hypothetical protein